MVMNVIQIILILVGFICIALILWFHVDTSDSGTFLQIPRIKARKPSVIAMRKERNRNRANAKGATASIKRMRAPKRILLKRGVPTLVPGGRIRFNETDGN